MSFEDLLAVVLVLLMAAAWILSRRPAGVGSLVVGACALIAVALGRRWVETGHPPVFGTWEMDLAQTFVLLSTGLGLARWRRRPYPRPALVVAGVTMAHALLLDAAPTPLTISERSLWIDLHAVLAWLAWALLFHALFAAFAGESEEELSLRLLGWGFAVQSAMGFVGAYYGTVLFATAWSWDPVQTLGLLSWLLTAMALHLRLFFNLSLNRQRFFLALVVAVFVLSAKLLMYLPLGQTFHVFELGVLAPEPG